MRILPSALVGTCVGLSACVFDWRVAEQLDAALVDGGADSAPNDIVPTETTLAGQSLCGSGLVLDNGNGGCVDLNECTNQLDDCDANATCNNTLGSYTCTCDSAFQDLVGDGKRCVDKCTLAACDVHAACTLSAGQTSCECSAPYRGDGSICTFDSECAALGCDGDAQCVVAASGQRACQCRRGYRGTGQQCSEIDECVEGLDDCDAHASCKNTDGSFACTCAPGYQGSGLECSDIDDCLAVPCQHGGRCADRVSGFVCDCSGTGHDGVQCQNDIKECSSAPCLNGGVCADLMNDFSCACEPGFSGKTCATDACDPNPCQHAGTCARTDQGANCLCQGTGYEGATCGMDSDECADSSHDCSKIPLATCANTPGSFMCTCPEGYMGTGHGNQGCADVNECLTTPCSADYPCANRPGGFVCTGLFADWPMPDQLGASAVKPSYTNDVNTVLDNVTHLMWERSVNASLHTVASANAYCAMAHAGFSDWRLPSKIELESLVDDGIAAPHINQTSFPGTPLSNFWTSSPYVGPIGPRNWAIDFAYGTTLLLDPTTTARIRCVRSTQTSPFVVQYSVDAVAGTVRDNRTGLTWQRDIGTVSYSFGQAEGVCSALGTAGGGWRLPTRKELLTLVDPASAIPPSIATPSPQPRARSSGRRRPLRTRTRPSSSSAPGSRHPP